MSDIEFNSQQKAAIQQAVDWYKGYADRRHSKQWFFLAGFAGTGKTTVARTIAELCAPSHRIAYIAPTGKAASRLKQKGCASAQTMHSFIYNVRGEDEDGEPIFIAKGALEQRPLLVVCDESSMLAEYDNKVLLSHGMPQLMLGDIGQVPPVKAKPAYSEANYDVLLDQIMRQGADSNIIRASMFVREGKRLPLREYEDVRVRAGQPSIEDLLDHADESSQIICAFNNTRTSVNRRVREALGYAGNRLPSVGEKVICTYNQHSHGFMNGEQGIVLGYEELEPDPRNPDDTGMRLRLKSLTNGKEKLVEFNPMSFDADEEVRKEAYRSIGGFDYGYCITIHKSQGSEWEHVLGFEEAIKNDYAKMMYTQITRAMKRYTMYRV